MVDFVETVEKLNIQKDDILLVRTNETLNHEYIEAIITTLRKKYKWDGMMILQRPGDQIDVLSDDEKIKLYEKLKEMLNK